MSFNWIDALLIFFVLLSVWGGWRRGFILSFLDLARWIGSLAAGLLFYRIVADLLAVVTGWAAMWIQPIAFILVLIVTSILIQFLGNRLLLRRIPKDVHERRVNKVFGLLPGLASGLITAAIVSALLFSVPFSDSLAENAQKSVLANRLAAQTDDLETALAPVFDPAIRQTLNRLIVPPESSESVELPFKVETTRPRPDLEAEMLELINRERTASNLAPLEADPEMTVVARKHSADMFARGYFSHQTPENKSPFDRMKDDNVRFRTAGENLALAPNLQIAHTGLMDSPGHRANILAKQFGRVGIGILDGGKRGLMVTQNFRN